MSSLLQKLFGTRKKSDRLTQGQREAIVDLLNYCIYADNHLALDEDKVLSDEVERFDWDPNVSYEIYAARSVARVRTAKETADARSAFLADIAKALGSKEAKQRAIALCRQVFRADHDVAASEADLLKEIQKALA